jgi:hypothetical protein
MSENLFEKLLDALAEGGVRFVLVGGVATALHGSARSTRDLDVIIEATPENVTRLISVLSNWGDGCGRELEVQDFVPAELGPIRVIEHYALDIFSLMRSTASGELYDYERLASDALEFQLPSGRSISFAAGPALIALKSGTGRAKDASDISTLLALSEIPTAQLRALPEPAPEAAEPEEPIA